LENRAKVEEVGNGVVAVDFEDFRDISTTGAALDMDDHVDRITDVGFDGPKAKVNPETTMATRESPRAIVLVKACCRTLTAFSHGELACANAGAASKREIITVDTVRDCVRVLRSNLFFRTMTSKRIGGKYSAISSDSLTPCLTAEMSGPQRVSNKQTHEEQMFRGMGSPQAYLQ